MGKSLRWTLLVAAFLASACASGSRSIDGRPKSAIHYASPELADSIAASITREVALPGGAWRADLKLRNHAGQLQKVRLRAEFGKGAAPSGETVATMLPLRPDDEVIYRFSSAEAADHVQVHIALAGE
jgi:hypothetical protein